MLKSRSIWYIPGFISLSLLLPSLVLYLRLNGFFEEYRMIKTYWARDENYGKGFLVPHPVRHYQTFQFTGDGQQDSLLLAQVASKLDMLLLQKDTLNGIRIQFGKAAPYRLMIETLDIFQERNHQDYHLSEKGILAFYKPVEIPTSTLAASVPFDFCGVETIYKEYWRAKDEERFERAYQGIIRSLWPILIPGLMLIYCRFGTLICGTAVIPCFRHKCLSLRRL